MSTELGMLFGQEHYEKYAEVIDAWASTTAGEKVTKGMAEKWGVDLYDALAEEVIEALMDKDGLAMWSSVSLPSQETLVRFSQISAKYTLQYATRDLLDRLIASSTYNKENPPDTVTAAIRPMRPSELAKRSPQTVAQIFDMAKDKFSLILSRQLTKSNQFTGRRRWETSGKDSRHASLNHEIKGPNEFFSYKGEDIIAPRPVGGSPASWSNCGCRMTFETKKGKWVG